MSKKMKTFDELTFTDDFMFCKVMTANPDLCKGLLELVLDIRIKEVKLAEAQKSISNTYDGKGIRLDVYVNDDAGTVYDMEMQTTSLKDIPKRSRYYQGMIDLNLIERGEPYSALKKSFVIFFCTFDAFGKALPVYSFENRCEEMPDLALGDETRKVFVNPICDRHGLTHEMDGFLNLLQGKNSDAKLASEIQIAVDRAKEHKEWRTEYMTLALKLAEERAEGKAEGKTEGQNLLVEAVRLLREGKTEDELKKAGIDEHTIQLALLIKA